MKGKENRIPYTVTRLAYAWEDDPMLGAEVGKQYAHLRRLVLDADDPAVEELRAAITRYPKVPHFRHLLTEHHEMDLGETSNESIRDELAAEFPTYLGSVVHLAGKALEVEDFARAEEILGPGCELHLLYPERRIFHEQEALPYELCAMRVLLGKQQKEEAARRLERIRAINPDSLVAEIAEPLFHYLSRDEEEEMEEEVDAGDFDYLDEYSVRAAKAVMERFNVLLDRQVLKAPSFRLALTQRLYSPELEMEADTLSALLAADRKDLIHDLEAVLDDALERYVHLSVQEEIPEFMVLHALYLLTEIGATESLDKVLAFLAAPAQFVEFWLGDVMYEDLWEVLYLLGGNQLDKLLSFAQDESHYTLMRCVVPDVLLALALHQPARRSEVVAALRQLLAAPSAKDLPLSAAQASFLGMTVNCCVMGRLAELLPEISRLYAMDLGVEEVAGNLRELKRHIAEPVADETLEAFKPLKGDYAARLRHLAEVLDI
jgi:hypothetical protein